VEHVDTLQMYKEYMASGYTEEQATTAVISLNKSFDSVVTAKDIKILENEILSAIDVLQKEFKHEVKWMWRSMCIIGGLCAVPVLERLIHLIPR